MTGLADVAKQLHESYKEWKASEKKKNKDKDAFFDLVTVEIDQGTLAQKTVLVPQEFSDNPEDFIKQNYPEWESISAEPDEDGQTKTILRENPKYKTFQYVDKEAKLVFSRGTKKGQVTIDDEALQEEDPELWDEITEVRLIPKELDELTPEQIARLRPYLHRKAPSLVLNAPRKATEEELEEA